jgi:hypothetical protein
MMFVFWVVTFYGLVSRHKDRAVCSSETPVYTYKSIRRYNPEDKYRYFHDRFKVSAILFFPTMEYHGADCDRGEIVVTEIKSI